MRYWVSFQSKWGFGEGESVPPDAWAMRYVYVREINRLAQRLGSAVRLLAYDRGGMHNSYLICRVNALGVVSVPELDLCKGSCCGGYEPEDRDWDEPADDAAMAEAIEHYVSGDYEDLDGLVEVDVSIKDEPETDIQISA